jgi:hypothetical protein
VNSELDIPERTMGVGATQSELEVMSCIEIVGDIFSGSPVHFTGID